MFTFYYLSQIRFIRNFTLFERNMELPLFKSEDRYIVINSVLERDHIRLWFIEHHLKYYRH
jgi:hypothetical protein